MTLFQKPPTQRPELVGGDEPPRGYSWQIFAVSEHHTRVIQVLALSNTANTSKTLKSIIDYYIENNIEQVNIAFENKRKNEPHRLNRKVAA